MSSASDTYINTQVQSALIEVSDERYLEPLGELDDIATALIEALEERGVKLCPMS